jgi:uncharacterized protein (TIGR04255 family)
VPLVSARKHYANAPITEGLIDIRVELGPNTTLESLDIICQQAAAEYPTREDRTLSEVQFSPDAREPSAKRTKVGYLLRSMDGRQVFQARLDGFTFSRLKPYQNWTALRDEAKRLWTIYREGVRPTRVTRVAVRYINQIDMPLPILDFKDYLRTVPEVSPDLPQGLGGFLMQLQIPQPERDTVLVLTEVLAPPQKADIASIILDIDLFRARADYSSDEDVWGLLEAFRDRKNEAFESCITDKARQLFEPVS